MKKTIFSGIQPSGNLHLGNYLGAITQWVEMQDDFNCIFCVVDYHAITVKQDPEELRKQIIDTAKIYLASGINPEKSTIFQQSEIKAHTELAWILNCTSARMSDLNKMTQFKDKAGLEKITDDAVKFLEKFLNKKGNLELVINEKENLRYWAEVLLGHSERGNYVPNVGVGLYDYPVLMAADILLYNTDVVPVGEDQTQHVELTRTLARRFNKQFAEVFRTPKLELRKEGARIMALDDPTKKMSKSAASENSYIALTDTPETAAKKIMKAATDSDGIVKHDIENKPGISNLLTIYSLLEGSEVKDLEKKYEGKGYGDFKKDLAEVVKKFLTSFQEKYNNISDVEASEILLAGAEKVQPVADETMDRVKSCMGIR